MHSSKCYILVDVYFEMHLEQSLLKSALSQALLNPFFVSDTEMIKDTSALMSSRVRLRLVPFSQCEEVS